MGLRAKTSALGTGKKTQNPARFEEKAYPLEGLGGTLSLKGIPRKFRG